MKYMGSKNRISGCIVPIITHDIHKYDCYVEPFMGGCNMLDKIQHRHRIGADSNEYLVAMFEALQDGWIPPDNVTEEEYKKLKQDDTNKPLKAFVGFCCSFSGKWFNGYARDGVGCLKPQNYALNGKKNLLRQIKRLDDVEFKHSSYEKLYIPDNSIVYCDPPYKGTTNYKDGFDHDKFYDWIRQSLDDKLIFISEYSMPDDFVCIWSLEILSSLDTKKREKTNFEKLFVHESQFKDYMNNNFVQKDMFE